jgi:Domain of unknown function (DUF4149)
MTPHELPGTGWKVRIAVFMAALWWGSLTITGFLVVPMLFAYLPTTQLAGQMAARLFTAQTWVTLGCGLALLLGSRSNHERPSMDWAGGALMFVLAGALLALLAEFAVAPRIVAHENLKLWHSVGTAMYILQWLCAGAVLWRVSCVRSAGPS